MAKKEPQRRLTDQHLKAIFKETIKEWLNEQFKEFGWWTLKRLGAAALAAILYIIAWKNGWRMTHQ